MSKPTILTKVEDLRRWTAGQRAAGKRIALVPTMGALHDGHLSLVREAANHADIVLVTIFVNPTQFGPNEDFASYPRTWEVDTAKLEAAGVPAVFSPLSAEMYQDGFTTSVDAGPVAQPLEGIIRPGHFKGVATVVTKLLLQSQADVALFGEKDYQQLCVIRRVVADLNIPVKIVGVPTARDKNGLALSSRNAYLTSAQYDIAARLNKVIAEIAERVVAGGDFKVLLADGRAELTQAGFDGIDYLEVRDAGTLGPPQAQKPMRVLAAVRLGATRLIDNMPVAL